MFPSTTTHVRKQLDEKLKLLLNSSYIINVLLKEFEPEIVQAFSERYIAEYNEQGERIKDGRDITVTTNYPQEDFTKEALQIYIGMGEGQQINTSIGQIEGEYYENSSETIRQEVTIEDPTLDDFTLALDKEPVPGSLSFRNMDIDDSIITYVSGETKVKVALSQEVRRLLGITDNTVFDLTYQPYASKEKSVGQALGFTSEETVQLVIMSSNMDIVRIADALVKASLILMRSESEEQSGGYSLGKIQYAPIAPIEGLPTTPNLVFGRQIDITYTVSYAMQKTNLQEIKNISIGSMKDSSIIRK